MPAHLFQEVRYHKTNELFHGFFLEELYLKELYNNFLESELHYIVWRTVPNIIILIVLGVHVCVCVSGLAKGGQARPLIFASSHLH